MNIKRRKYYEEIAKSKGKEALIEECSISLSSSNIQLMEKVSLIEDTTGHQYEAVGIIKNVPISKYTENANGRVYSKQLWEEVKRKKMGEGSLCMADHPEDDHDSVKDIYGVWHNMKINEDMVTMDLYLVEEKPLKVLKAGGSIGTSSVGYGTLNESDGKTVDPSSFELERSADLVYRPSQGTFATHKNLQEDTTNKKEIKESDNILTESLTNNKEDKLDENINLEKDIKRNDKMIDKIKEAEYVDKTRQATKIAKASSKLSEAIEDLKYFKQTLPEELVSCHTKVDDTIKEIASKLEEQVASTHVSLKEKENALDEITAKYKTTEQAYNQLKEDYKKAEALVKTLQEGQASEETSKLIEGLKKNCQLMESDIAIFKEEIEKRDKDIAIFIKERKDMLDDLAIYEKQEKKLKESLKTCQLSKKKAVKEDEEYEDISSYGDANPEDLDLPAPDEDVLDVDMETGDLYDIEDDLEPVDSLDLDELDAEGLIEEEDEEDKDKDEDEEEMKEEEEDEESKEDKEEDKKEKEDKKEESTKKSIKVKREIFEHYKKAVKKNPALKDVRNQIFTAKSLFEAAKLIEAFIKRKQEKDGMLSLKEKGIKLPSKIEEYKFTR